MTADPMEVLARKIDRERRARLEAESLLEKKSLELYYANQGLRDANATLEQRVRERTRELAQARDEAMAANRAKSEFLANMSHELRSPLNAILGFSEIMSSEMFGSLGSDRYREYARHIMTSGRHLLSLINDLLDLAKIESGHMELHDESCDVAEIVEQAARLFSEHALRAGIKLEVTTQARLPRLWADERRIRQVFYNLLSNAIKFTPQGGCVRVGARVVACGAMEVRVEDTGIGIAPEKIDLVMQPFTQIENVMTRGHAGSGLGLPICRALVELHGGELRLVSEQGKGTVATIVVPKERVMDSVVARANPRG